MRIKNLVEMIKHNGLLASMAQLEKLYQVAIENEQKLSEFEARCAALAAENTGLKAVCEDRRAFIMNGVQLGYIQVPTVETDPALETIRVAVSPQEPTPATDAFLAEVRAAAVDEVCLKISTAIVNCYQDELIGLDEAATICGDFASELRKGVQS
ncbi:hypothetical protein [Enterobacter hormaechei]|uniref:hypothetical protein n=1 Tax=Enterobacter hormaechei TaxID=158836 RepID=UPI00313453E6